MQYQQTVTLDSRTLRALRRGDLILQPGQWVKAPGHSRKSRWVEAHQTWLEIVHPQGSGESYRGISMKAFRARCRLARDRAMVEARKAEEALGSLLSQLKASGMGPQWAGSRS